jgi:endonuclease/exonuclease/phosphatase family metal-dependent hydrolase
VIIAGDFNDWKTHGNRTSACNATCTKPSNATMATSPAPTPRLPLLRLDRIYLRNAESHGPRILGHKPWSHLSDHLPLAVEVRL